VLDETALDRLRRVNRDGLDQRPAHPRPRAGRRLPYSTVDRDPARARRVGAQPSDGAVEVVATGDSAAVERLVEWCRRAAGAR
jgi:hypothetical protein